MRRVRSDSALGSSSLTPKRSVSCHALIDVHHSPPSPPSSLSSSPITNLQILAVHSPVIQYTICAQSYKFPDEILMRTDTDTVTDINENEKDHAKDFIACTLTPEEGKEDEFPRVRDIFQQSELAWRIGRSDRYERFERLYATIRRRRSAAT